MRISILLVESDELLGECIRYGLGYYRYSVEWVKDGSEANVFYKQSILTYFGMCVT